jgi:tetratricopeptide (TPR) repeat protein
MSPLALAAVFTAGLFVPTQPPTRTPLPVIDVAALPGTSGQAIGAAYAAARAQPENPELVGHLAIVLHAWEQWDEAAQTYRAVRSLAPHDMRWWYLAGLLEVARGRHSDAVPLLDRAVALAPGNAAARLRLAEARLEASDLAGSEPLLVKLAQDPATAAPAEYALGRIAMGRGDDAGALEHLERAVELFPDFGAAHYARALIYRRKGRSAEAQEALQRQQKCVACWPAVADAVGGSIAAAREDARASLARGLRLAAEGNDKAAIEAHEQALALSPALVQARVNLITLYGRTGRWADAEAQYRQVLSGGTNLGEAHANYAQVLLAQRRAADALPVFREALAANPANGSARNGLGLALEMTGDAAEALAAYEQAVADAPTLRAARFNYGRALLAAGRLQDAIAQFDRLLQPEDEETPRYLFALAAARVRAGDVEAGRAQATTSRRKGRASRCCTSRM